ncbi:MAG: sodium ABC transporter ATP-binding protein, partial [Staphylococcus xylosus]|nr:sodium ABC transporter ATP-binding protein [Staphylococcus xylosus]
TTHANVFKEIFGNEVAITKPKIEELMVFLEKGIHKIEFENDGIS